MGRCDGVQINKDHILYYISSKFMLDMPTF